MKMLGYGLLISGALIQVSETVAKQGTNTALGGQTFEQTALGKIVAPIEGILPVSLGWTLIIAGVIIVWVAPHMYGGQS